MRIPFEERLRIERDEALAGQRVLGAQLLAARETIERVTKERDSEAREAQAAVDCGCMCPSGKRALRAVLAAEPPKPAALSIEPRPWWVVLPFEAREVPMLHAEARKLGIDFAEKTLQQRAGYAIDFGVHPAEVARALDEARAELLAEQPKPAGGGA